MTPPPDQWSELERLARGSTPGPWRRDENSVWGACNPDDTTSYGMGINIVDCRSSVPQWAREPLDYEKSETNAAFIAAANPSTVLSLIARIATLEGALDEGAEWLTDVADVVESPNARVSKASRRWKADLVREWAGRLRDARKGGG